MLQRAASNAYSWWWASHIRTKQSKWMEQNLQDMEEKVQNALKLIEEDGDSFARRAEMYYKKRPELINFVEESYRAYRALAERYDHISTELQNANNTIAAVFPEQVQFSMDEEDEEDMPKFSKKPPESGKGNIPKVPKAPTTDLKSVITSATKKLKSKKTLKPATAASAPKSGLTKPQACQEIDKLQKQILTLQTEKEFVKSSYESGVAKYWEIENQITEMQERICTLQDEFGEGMVIEDNEARNLMAKAALKSCQESLAQLQEKQERSAEEARTESARIREARERFESLKGKFSGDETSPEKPHEETELPRQKEEPDCLAQEDLSAVDERQQAEELRKKIKKHFESDTSLSMTDMAEKIDELVNKVISLESALSSQTALVKRLRSETDELHTHIRNLEDDKASTIDGKNNLQKKLKSMEEKLGVIQDLNQKVNDEKSNLHLHFIEAHCNLDHLSEKLPSINLDEELEPTSSSSSMVLKQPDEELKAPQSSNDLVAEPLNSESNFEKACASVTATNQINNDENQVNSLDSERHSEKSHVNGAVRNQVEVDQTQDTSPSSEGDYKKSDVNDTARSQEEIGEIQDESTDMESKSDVQKQGNPEHPLAKTKDVKIQGSNRDISIDMEETKDVKDQDGKFIDMEGKSDMHKQANPEHPLAKTKDVKIQNSNRDISVDMGETKDVKDQDKDQDKSIDMEATKDVEDQDKSRDTEGKFDVYKQTNQEHPSEESKDVLEQDREQETSSQTVGIVSNAEPEEETMKKEDEPNWRELFLSGMEEREKLLLTEYTATLRNFKDVKKQLNEKDVKHHDETLQTSKQLSELKTSNALKDEEIRSLRNKLHLMQKCFYESKESIDFDHQKTSGNSTEPGILKVLISAEEESDAVDISKLLVHQPTTTSEIEERLRLKIDELLEENLDFWLKFGTSFHQVQKFETEIQDLKSEVTNLQEKGKKLDESGSTKYSLKSEARPLYKHLREIQTELTVWSDKSAALKEELQSRFASLCSIQEEITAGLKASAEDDDFSFTSYQAAKFQGEVLNMKQENNKVADELESALEHLATLQAEVESTLSKLNEEFRLSGSKKQELRHSESRGRVPLRSFIFGIKPKKQRPSIFAGMAPVMQRKYYNLRAGPPL